MSLSKSTSSLLTLIVLVLSHTIVQSDYQDYFEGLKPIELVKGLSRSLAGEKAMLWLSLYSEKHNASSSEEGEDVNRDGLDSRFRRSGDHENAQTRDSPIGMLAPVPRSGILSECMGTMEDDRFCVAPEDIVGHSGMDRITQGAGGYWR